MGLLCYHSLAKRPFISLIPSLPYLGNLEDLVFQRAARWRMATQTPQSSMWVKKTLLYYAIEILGPICYCNIARTYPILIHLIVRTFYNLHVLSGLSMGQLLLLRKQQNGALTQVCYSDLLFSLKCNHLQCLFTEAVRYYISSESREDHSFQEDRDTWQMKTCLSQVSLGFCVFRLSWFPFYFTGRFSVFCHFSFPFPCLNFRAPPRATS